MASVRSMQVMVVLSALESIPSRFECQIESRRAIEARDASLQVLSRISQPGNKEKFEHFATTLVDMLQSIVCTARKDKCLPVKQREHIWVEFGKVRVTCAKNSWEKFVEGIDCAHISDACLGQLVLQVVFENVIADEFSISLHQIASKEVHEQVLSKDELNIIRYASGFVATKLLSRYMKMSSEKAATFVECLSEMAVEGPETSLLDYTKEWMQRIDRGGLFELKDSAFQLFVAIENTLSNKLKQYLHTRSISLNLTNESKKLDIIEKVKTSYEVQFHWTVLAADISSDEESIELLIEVIKLWMTIRGFSIVKMWMEQYKKSAQTTTQKKKGLRKGLKESKDHTK